VAIVIAGAVGMWYLRKVNPDGAPGPAVNFTVGAGDTLQDDLRPPSKKEGLVSDAGVFRWYVDHNGGLALTPGYYRIHPKDHHGT